MIQTHNQTIKEPKASQCHKCKYLTCRSDDMDEHVLENNGFIRCDRCEYISEDNDIMKKHMMKHTGDSIYSCNICEFEATRQSLLENHMEAKHTKITPWWHESKKTEHFCDKKSSFFFI